MNYSSLLAIIAQNIYENHRGEVTANKVKAACDSIVNSLGFGYQFRGAAAPGDDGPGSIDQRVFYIASTPGTYSGFGGLTLAANEVALLKWDSAWSKETLDIPSKTQIMARLAAQDAQIAVQDGRLDGQDQEIADFEEAVRYMVENYPNITINGDVVNAPDEEDITTDENNLLKFANRPALNGMGYIILRKNKTFAEQVTQQNTIYEIRYDFTIDADVNIPADSVLKFVGGSINGEYSIIGNNTAIQADSVPIFGTDLSFGGAWNNNSVNLSWFGAKAGDDTFDNAIALSSAIKFANYSHSSILVNGGIYYFLSVIDIDDLVLPDCDVCAFALIGEHNQKSPSNRNAELGVTFVVGDSYFMYSGSGDILIQGNVQYINFVPTDNVKDAASIFGCSLRQSEFAHCFVRHFLAFVYNGVIVTVSSIHNNSFAYIKHLVYYDGEAVNPTLITDSSITDNYINGSIKDSSLLYGGAFGLARFTNNFVDFFKYIITGKPSDTKYITNSCIMSNNIFDYCYSFCDGSKELNSLIFDSNVVNKNNWDFCDSTWFWLGNADANMKDEAWVFFRIKNRVFNCVITNNKYEGDFLLVADNNSVVLATRITDNSCNNRELFVYLGDINPTSRSGSCTIDGWKWQDDRRISVPLHFIKMLNSPYFVEECGGPTFAPRPNLNSPYNIYFPETLSPITMGTLYLSYIYMNPMWGKLYLESASEYVDYENSIVCAKSKSTNRVTQCSYADAYTFYNNSLIAIDDVIYLYDFCFFLKVTGVTDGHINGNVVGDVLHSSLYGLGIPLIKDGNTPVYNNLTVLDGGVLKRYNNGTLAAISNGREFYFKLVTSTEIPLKQLYANKVFYDTGFGKLLFNANSRSVDVFGNTPAKSKGETTERPTNLDKRYDIGFCFYDTTLGRPIWAQAITSQQVVTWIERDGARAGVNRSGTFAQKPAGGFIYVGFAYFCTDKQTAEGGTDGIMIYYKGSNVWVDALGRTIS